MTFLKSFIKFSLSIAFILSIRKANADDINVIASTGELGALAREMELTAAPIILSCAIKAEYLRNYTAEQKSEMINRYFNQFFPKHLAQISRFKHMENFDLLVTFPTPVGVERDVDI